MKCQNCHNDNFDYEKFCHVCGVKLIPESNPNSSNQNKNKHYNRDFLLRLFVGFLLSIAFILYELRTFGMLKLP